MRALRSPQVPTTGACTWITAGAGEMYSTATICGNCRGVWGPPAPCPLPLGLWASVEEASSLRIQPGEDLS